MSEGALGPGAMNQYRSYVGDVAGIVTEKLPGLRQDLNKLIGDYEAKVGQSPLEGRKVAQNEEIRNIAANIVKVALNIQNEVVRAQQSNCQKVISLAKSRREEIATLTATVASLTKEKGELEGQLTSVKASGAASDAENQTKIDGLSVRIKELETMIAGKNGEIDKLTQELADAKATIESLTQSVASHQEAATKLTGDLAGLRIELDKAKRDLTEAQDSLHSLKATIGESTRHFTEIVTGSMDIPEVKSFNLDDI